jgi:hypothetical protein
MSLVFLGWFDDIMHALMVCLDVLRDDGDNQVKITQNLRLYRRQYNLALFDIAYCEAILCPTTHNLISHICDIMFHTIAI